MELSAAATTGALTGDQIRRKIDTGEFQIRPLLDPSQVTETGIDFRLGYDFLVGIQGREPYINTSLNSDEQQRNVHQFFQATRRQLGETFILHPHQTVLAVTLEYVKIPSDLFLMLYLRSSYSRLGLTVSTIAQPGYCGCISLEMTNPNHTPLNLTIGARILQAVMLKVSNPSNYFHSPRKYLCHVRPEPSAAALDTDLEILNTVWKTTNHYNERNDEQEEFYI